MWRIKTYLKRNAKGILLFFLIFATIAIVFTLYHLPLEALYYPFLLCGCFGLAMTVIDFTRFLEKHKQLERLQILSGEVELTLPKAESVEEEDYQRIILALETSLREIESASLTSKREMMEYYSTWVHQIKTPIASMRLTLENEDSPLERRLSSDLLRIEQYVEMVMTYLRLESSSTDYVFTESDVDSVIRQSVAKFSSEFIGRGIGLEYTPINETLITDEKWLALVIEQILSNALKYTNEGTISIFKDNGWLAITDTGIGIAPEDLPRVFEKGYTGYNGRYDKKASGLGLYLCKRICDNLRIDIRLESKIGEGTTVRLNLNQYSLSLE